MLFLAAAMVCLMLPASLQDTGETPQEFSLILSPATPVIKHFTKDVKLLCKNADSGQSKFSEIFTIRIEKQSNGTESSWEHIADISGTSQSPTIKDPNVSAHGKVTPDVVGSYIAVTWAVASEDTVGFYRCDIAGVDKNLNILSESTPVVEIKKEDLSASDVFDILLHEIKSNKDSMGGIMREIGNEMDELKRENDGKIDEVRKENDDKIDEVRRENDDKIDEVRKESDDKIDEVRKENDDKIDEVRKEVSNNTVNIKAVKGQLSEINTEFQKEDEEVDNIGNRLQEVEDKFKTKWPRGQFALLQPDTGCPDDPAFVQGEVAVRRIHTESSSHQSPQTFMSQNTHLSTPIQESEGSDHFLNLRFCSVSIPVSPVHWPTGTYCINKYMTGCPVGFLNGSSYVYLDEENDNYKGTHQGSFFTYNTYYLEFCCTNNAPPDQGMHLPINSPFYLYRFGGRCQTVAGMSVTHEFIDIDTEDTENQDGIHGFHPDVSFDVKVGNFRIELCYYKRF